MSKYKHVNLLSSLLSLKINYVVENLYEMYQSTQTRHYDLSKGDLNNDFTWLNDFIN